MSMQKLSMGLAVGVCLASTAAAAEFQYLTQERFVEINDGTPVSINSPDFSQFTESLSILDPDNSATYSAEQDSTLGTDSIVVSGGAGASGLNASFGTADSSFDVTFSLAEAVNYTFDATLIFFDTSYKGLIWLTGPADATIVRLDGQTESQASLSGSLAAGTYRLRATARGVNDFDQDNSEDFQLAFSISEIPTPGTAAIALPGLMLAGRRRRG